MALSEKQIQETGAVLDNLPEVTLSQPNIDKTAWIKAQASVARLNPDVRQVLDSAELRAGVNVQS